jgi:hypothetical protein
MPAMQPRPPRRTRENDLWVLPRVMGVEFRPIRLEKPRAYYVGHERRETREMIEILLRTATPIPIRAISPVLYIGEVGVEDYEVAGHNEYRFLAFEPKALAANATVALGWPGRPADSRIALTTRYKPNIA